MNNLILPSIIANSQKEFDSRMKKVRKLSGTFHLDVMEGEFVKNRSLMFNFKLPRFKKYRAHLMVKNPLQWINKNGKKVNMIIFHPEPLNDKKILEFISIIKKKRKKVGLAINPKTSVEKIKPYLDKIDFVLVMTVNPGKYGAKFQPLALKKIKQIKKINPKITIGVDGGITNKTILRARKAGADKFVSGSYLQKDNPGKAIKLLANLIK